MRETAGLAMITAFVVLSIGCQSPPDASAPTQEDTITENDRKINDRNHLGGDVKCPPPREHDEMCIQVITWALTKEGICCEYPTPCDVPEGLETFSTKEECEKKAELD